MYLINFYRNCTQKGNLNINNKTVGILHLLYEESKIQEIQYRCDLNFHKLINTSSAKCIK